jgi:hypothetical protein
VLIFAVAVHVLADRLECAGRWRFWKQQSNRQADCQQKLEQDWEAGQSQVSFEIHLGGEEG